MPERAADRAAAELLKLAEGDSRALHHLIGELHRRGHLNGLLQHEHVRGLREGSAEAREAEQAAFLRGVHYGRTGVRSDRPPTRGQAAMRAEAFLLHELADGAEVESQDMYSRARREDIAKRTLERVKPRLVKSVDRGGKSYWRLRTS